MYNYFEFDRIFNDILEEENEQKRKELIEFLGYYLTFSPVKYSDYFTSQEEREDYSKKSIVPYLNKIFYESNLGFDKSKPDYSILLQPGIGSEGKIFEIITMKNTAHLFLFFNNLLF